MSDYTYEKDESGIVTVTLDMDGQSANTMNTRYIPMTEEILARLQGEEGLAGVVMASAKKTFFAGGDLNGLRKIDSAGPESLAMFEANKAPFRAMEKLPVPFVAAINGA